MGRGRAGPGWLRTLAHHRGWLASPSLAYRGVPFGPQKRDLAAEVQAAIRRAHDPAVCHPCVLSRREDSCPFL
ncbi:hypothetical protein GCM10010387_15470 [Streptomyces inusitatus]|uniref:Uncharacterized protein n=1 Tax=Streptomyces inusitatus TaxID=68221 RepID=A0A918PWQ6_9ACTN|nr:hypothetical protein GCM10010387_15470 [Streptomyces inusitatus]